MAANGIDGKTNAFSGKIRSNFGFKVTFPTLPSLDGKPQSILLRQKPYQHEIAKISFDSISPSYFDLLKTGVPVQIDSAVSGASASWYGYVSTVSKSVSSQKLQPMVVTCIGSTFPLKERDNRVFSNSTISEAVQTIVQENGFRFIGDSSERRFPQLNMAGHSYWEWIVEQAKRTGFGVWVDGTDFYFRDLNALINQTISGAPVLSLSDQNVSSYGQLFAPTLDTFTVLHGEYVESPLASSRAVKNVGGVDPVTMAAHYQSSSPADLGGNLRAAASDVLFQEFQTGEVADSSLTAGSSARSASELARFSIPAKATAQGNPLVHPFGTVYLQGTGTSTDGYWVVQEAEHILRREGGVYSMSLSLATDGTGASDSSAFRQGTPMQQGFVNVAEALNRTSSSTSTSGSAKPVLSRFTPGTGVANQGYLRTPTRWASPRRS